jgi:Toxin SymE, type I toxin-antitoxin system
MKRQIKIGKMARMNSMHHIKWVPSLRLHGEWLKQMGVEAGQKVEIEKRGNKIIITLIQGCI